MTRSSGEDRGRTPERLRSSSLPAMMAPMPLLTDAEVADRLGMTIEDVRRRCRSGEFAHIRIGRRYRFTEADYEAILTSHHRDAKPAPSPNPWGIRRRAPRRGVIASLPD